MSTFKYFIYSLMIIFVTACGSGGTSSETAKLTEIQISPTIKSLPTGLSQQFTATGVYSDGSNKNITSLVSWNSSDSLVSSMGVAGLFTTIAAGTTTISASLNGINSNDTSASSTLSVTAAELVSIAVSPTNPSTPLGVDVDFTATGTYTDASTQNITTLVTWDSATPATSTISNATGTEGKATPVVAGTTTISASLNGINSDDTSASSALTVTAAELVSIAVSPTNPSTTLGVDVSFTATGTYTDASTQNITTLVTWDSATTATATISNAASTEGKATPVTTGTTTISASLNGINSDDTSASSALTVTAAELVSIAVSPTNPSTTLGVDVSFTATGTYTDASTQNITTLVTWDSATTATATISNAASTEGKATPVTTGTTTISASLSGINSDDTSASSALTVTAAELVSIAVSPTNPSTTLGVDVSFTATGTYTDASTQNITTLVTWDSATPGTATISNAGGTEGLATPVAVGTTVINATDAVSGIKASDTAQTQILTVAIYASCKEILINTPSVGDGDYLIDPNGGSDADAFSVNCDMTRDGGGWTLFLKTWYQQPSIAGNTGAVGVFSDGLTHKGASYKLSDADVNLIIGANQNFDILADQSGYNSLYSTGNYEYVILRNYTGTWTFGSVVAPSTTTTQFESYRLSDDALAHTFNLSCGTTGGWGINCLDVLLNNPEGGTACSINMGSQGNIGWHHFYMHEHNTDTYLYICNGAQHSSSIDMNHRWWVRER